MRRLPGDMVRVAHSQPINFDDWEFNCGEFNKLVAKCAAEGVHNSLEDYPPSLSLPYYWGETDGNGGPPVTDPLTIYLHLAFDVTGDGECLWSVSLLDMLRYAYFMEQEDNPDAKYKPSDAALDTARRLRELADLLETGPGDGNAH